MENFYSKVETGKLHNAICRGAELTAKRINLTDPAEFLQVAGLRLTNGDTFRPHRHIRQERVTLPSKNRQDSTSGEGMFDAVSTTRNATKNVKEHREKIVKA